MFACTEIAVISLNDNKLEKLAAAGDKRADEIAKLTAQPARFLSTIQGCHNFFGIFGQRLCGRLLCGDAYGIYSVYGNTHFGSCGFENFRYYNNE